MCIFFGVKRTFALPNVCLIDFPDIIATAFMHDPLILVLDEPSSGLVQDAIRERMEKKKNLFGI